MINIPNIGVVEFSEDYWECCDVKTEAGYVEPSILISNNKETHIIYSSIVVTIKIQYAE